MSFATILTVVDQRPESRARLKSTLALAQRLNAKLQAVAFGLIHTPMMMSESYSAAMYEAESKAATEAATAAIDAAKAALGVDAPEVELSVVTGFATAAGSALAARALYADLVVLGQPDEDDPAGEQLIESVLFDTPTPLLIAPKAGLSETLGQRVAIGWDARPEASRAARAAMPFLEKAQSVDIVTVAHTFGMEPFGEDPGVAFAAWLARRGVEAELRQLNGSPVSEILLSDAKSRGDDLLVMGGYGHSRLVESLFGGVTKDLLRKSDIALFMAH